MRSQFFFIFGAVIALYFAAAAYSGLAVLRLFNKQFAPWQISGFWVLWLMMAVLPFVVTFGKSYFSGIYTEWLKIPGYYWLVFIYYFTLLLLAANGLCFIGKKIQLIDGILPSPRQLTVCVFFLVVIVLSYGTYNAQNPVIRSYDLTIPKNTGGLSSLRAVLVADSHLGFIVDNKRLERMTDMINSQNPDIVFLAGDIIEDGPRFFAEHKMGEIFRKLKPRLGVYAVLGNHEYINGPAAENVRELEKSGIFVLRDRYVKIEDSFYIVGRDDISLLRFDGKNRLELASIMEGVDRSLPVILLDHQPFSLDEAREQKADLLLAGHTHRGQFFPNNFITSMMFENDWGYLEKGGLKSIVTSGFGTWGPPVRIGNSPEIVNINITFKD